VNNLNVEILEFSRFELKKDFFKDIAVKKIVDKQNFVHNGPIFQKWLQKNPRFEQRDTVEFLFLHNTKY